MERLRNHYICRFITVLSDRFTFWNLRQNVHDSLQDWEVEVRQAGSLCEYDTMADELFRDKFILGLLSQATRTDLLKANKKAYGSKKTLSDVVAEAKTQESANQTNKLIVDTARNTDGQVLWTCHRHMNLKREAGTCH